MGARKLAGFTIIETMLVVSISGVLIVSLLVGLGASLNEQRYRDATETFKSLLQQQYADINNVKNDRDDNWTCGPTAEPAASPTGPVSQIRGQSKCVLMGKYLRIENANISEYTVVGYQSGTGEYNDIASLKNNYVLNVAKSEVVKRTMEWGAKISYPEFKQDPSTHALIPFGTPRSPRKVGILFIKSPDSGQIYTFSNKEPNVPDEANIGPTTFANLLVAGDSIPGQGARTICIDSNGLSLFNDRAVYINSFASGASAVEVRSNDFMSTIGAGLKC